MRILHVSDGYLPRLGGIELFVEELARRQRDAGHDVAVLTSTPDSGSADHGPVPVSRSAFSGLLGRVDLTSYDVVHAHLSVFSPTASHAIGAAGRRGVPVVATVHSMWTGWVPAVRALGPLVGRHPVVWTAVSAAAADDMTRVVGDTPVQVVPNAVDVDWWRCGPKAPRDDVVTLVSVMRLATRKRPMQLLQILGELVAKVPDRRVRLVVAGDGSHAKPMADWLQHHALDDRVLLTGSLPRPAIREVLGVADLFVAPAFQESFGIAALEARAVGVPVAAMASGGVGEFITDGVDGMLCTDDADMVTRLAALIRESGRLRALQQHAAAVPPAHDWSTVLDRFGAVYDLAAVAQPGRSVLPLLRRSRLALRDG